MILRKAAFLLILSLFAFSLACFAFPASASNPHTINPTQSIQEAINNADEGDTIFMKNGTYTQSLIIVNKTVTLLGESPEGTIIDGERTDDAAFILNVITSNVRIMNLTVQNTTIGSGSFGVQLAIVQNAEVSGCIIKDSGTGIRLLRSNSCRIERNTIIQNTEHGIPGMGYGIRLEMDNDNNLIRDNLVSGNSIGIQAEENSGRNVIYHNNFVGNPQQTAGPGVGSSKWDNGYPSGGNYWSDYSGGDSFNGLNQNLTGSDGIGDRPYPNPAAALDNYPFMGEIRMFWAGKWGSDYYVWIASNSTEIVGFRFNNNSIPHLQFNVTGSNFTCFCRVAVSRQLMWVGSLSEWQVFINFASETPLINNDAEYTYFYLNYTHGINETKIIQINGTHTIPEPGWPFLIVVLMVSAVRIFLSKKRLRRRVCAETS